MWEGGNDVWRFANDMLSESLWEINLMHLENITEFYKAPRQKLALGSCYISLGYWSNLIFWELYVCVDSDQKVEVWSYKPGDRESILEN